jgi:hypothetical protein
VLSANGLTLVADLNRAENVILVPKTYCASLLGLLGVKLFMLLTKFVLPSHPSKT